MGVRNKMRILVTGGAGFVGSHVCEYFAERNHEVISLDNLGRWKLLGKDMVADYNWRYLEKYDNIEFIRGDVRDFDRLRDLCRGVDAIIHAAAQVAVTTSLLDPRTDFDINVTGTFNLLEAAKLSRNPTFIFCSTNKVYGSNVNRIPVLEREKRYEFAGEYKKGIPEDFPVDLCEHTPYGCSKLSADLYVQDYAERRELNAGVFRMSCIYGTRQFGVEDQGWIAWFTIATLTDKQITIYGDGKQVRDVLWITDLIKAFDSFLKKGGSGVYNIGGGCENTLSLLELLDLLQGETGKQSRISYENWRSGDQKVYISDISKAEKELKWRPEVSVRDGVKKLVEWVTENKILFR
jgi:CDP-paratose 2-epimerase